MFKKRLLFIIFFVVSYALVAQVPPSVYEVFTEQNGLPSNYLNCLLQDQQGFIWIGSDKGLTRFDGTAFRTYTTDDGLAGNMILDIKEDETGKLWIGTFERGLCRFDGQNFDCWGKAHGIKSVHDIFVVNEKKIFYAEGAGKLFRFDVDTEQHSTLIEERLSGVANAIVPLNDKQILFPCGNRIFQIKENGRVQALNFKKARSSFFIKQGVKNAAGQVWLLDSNEEVLLRVEVIDQQLEVLDSLPALNYNADVFARGENFIFNSVKRNTTTLLRNAQKNIQEIPNPHRGQNIDLLIDRDQQLWLATIGYGLFIQKAYPYLQQLPQQSGAVYDVELLENGNITVGGDEGIRLYDPQLNLLGYQGAIKQVRSLKVLDGLGLCAGTLIGQSYFFEDELSLLNFEPQGQALVSSGVSGVVGKSSGEAIFSSYGAGLRLFSQGEIQDVNLPALPNLMVEGLFETAQGIWATSASDGVLLIGAKEQRLFSKQTGLPSNNVYCVFESTADSIWIGTENGASCWNAKEGIQSFSKAEGLVGKRITAFFKDKNQNLWALSDRFLHRWQNGFWQAFKSLSFQSVPEGRVYDVAYDASTHRVFIAATTGAFVLNLAEMMSMTAPLDFILAAVSTTQGLLDTAQLTVLDPEDNTIRIDFSLPSYQRAKENRCYFRLLEQGNTWTHAKEPNSFQFDNLSSGSYTLQVQTENPDGVKGEIKTIARFKILPPIWLRWWAIVLAFVLAILAVGGIVAAYFRQKNKKRLAALRVERELQAERERISRDLHDNIGAQLTNITYKLDLATHQSKDAKEAKAIESVSEDTRNTMKLLRDTIWALQKDEFSLEDLAYKLQTYLNRLEGIPTRFSLQKNIINNDRLSPKEVLHLFRIIQEAIQNIIKHAGASMATIIFIADASSFTIEIKDNGNGFAEQQASAGGHYGLENMAFRAKEINAVFSMESEMGKGTSIKIVKQPPKIG